MKWDGQTVTEVISIVLAFCALGVMIQTGFAQINSDIRELHTRIGDVDIGLRQEIGSFDSRLRGGIQGLENRLTARIDDLDNRLTARIDDLENRLRSMAISVDSRLDSIENRLTRIEVHLFGVEPEAVETP